LTPTGSQNCLNFDQAGNSNSKTTLESKTDKICEEEKASSLEENECATSIQEESADLDEGSFQNAGADNGSVEVGEDTVKTIEKETDESNQAIGNKSEEFGKIRMAVTPQPVANDNNFSIAQQSKSKTILPFGITSGEPTPKESGQKPSVFPSPEMNRHTTHFGKTTGDTL
jgi:hypothetical protein